MYLSISLVRGIQHTITPIKMMVIVKRKRTQLKIFFHKYYVKEAEYFWDQIALYERTY